MARLLLAVSKMLILCLWLTFSYAASAQGCNDESLSVSPLPSPITATSAGLSGSGSVTVSNTCQLTPLYALAVPLNGTAPQPGDPLGILQHDPLNWVTVTQPTPGPDARFPGLCTFVPSGSTCSIFTFSIAQDNNSGDTIGLGTGTLFNRVGYLFLGWGNVGQLPSMGEVIAGIGQHGVGSAAPPPSITTPSLPTYIPWTSYSAPLSATGGTPPYTWSATGLPAGFSVNGSTITGNANPSVSAGTYTVQLTATDANQQQSAPVSLSMNVATLQIREVLPVQAVYSPVAFVLNKPFAVKVQAEVDQPRNIDSLSIPNMDVLIDWESNSQVFPGTLSFSPNFVTTLGNIAYTATTIIDPHANSQQPFIPTQLGTENLTALITLANVPLATADTTLTVVQTNPLRVLYLPVVYGFTDIPSNFQDTVTNSDIFLKAIMPAESYSSSFFSTFEQAETTEQMDARVVGLLATLNEATRGVAIVPSDYFTLHSQPDVAGETWPSFPKGALATDGYWTVPAHELGHTFGLPEGTFDVPEEYTVNPNGIGTDNAAYNATGYWVGIGEMKNLPSFMGTGPFNLLFSRWINNQDYNYLLTEFENPIPDPQVVLVTGILGQDNSFALSPSYLLTNGSATPSDTSGTWSVQVQDALAQTISETQVPVEFTVIVEPGGPQPTSSVPILWSVPFPSNAVSVTVLNNGNPIMTIPMIPKLLLDAISLLPDFAFTSDPTTVRTSLTTLVQSLGAALRFGANSSSVAGIMMDLTNIINNQIIDLTSADPRQMTKAQFLFVLGQLTQNLATIPSNSNVPGDVNGDGKVDCTDFSIVQSNLGKTLGQVGFNPQADLNGDGVVDASDLALVTQHLPPGLTCSTNEVRLTLASTQLTYPGATNVVVAVAGTPTATGTVNIYDGTTLLTTANLQGNGDAYWYISPGLTAGTHQIYATYGGDANHPAGQSAPVNVTVAPVGVNFGVACWSANPTSYQCTINVSSNAGAALGSITYSLDSGIPVILPLTYGNAQFTVVPGAGSHTLVIQYPQQGNFAASQPVTETFVTQ